MSKRIDTVQSVIDYLIDHGVSEYNTTLLLHTNHAGLGDENTSILSAAQQGKWDAIWNFVELYVNGDLW